MNRGFNSNIQLGHIAYHVQTEDRGSDHPFIDTTVYAEGRVLHRRSTSYQELVGSARVSRDELQQRIEQQHRGVIEELRAGTLKLEPAGIEVQLLNPTSWLASGKVTLQIEARDQVARQPVADVSIEATLEGAPEPARFAARTNAQGYAELSFSLPPLGPNGATLVIRAVSPSGEEEIRYQVRPKPRAAEPEAPSQ